jgi:pseudouridine-5'-phosphate glycosidase
MYTSQVRQALDAGEPVIALESNVISSGLPYPQNIEIAQAVERAAMEEGAIPATIGLLHGEIHIGLTADEIEFLGTAQNMRKISRRDLALALARGWSGGTTVAATMYLAHRAGISVFATGGIGGVHRGQPFDVSADLPELAQTPVVVVCSGAKSILDLPLTLEWLETHGVPVLGYQTDEFPAFYTRHSGLAVDCQINSPDEILPILRAQEELGLHNGLLVTAPVPSDSELDATDMARAVYVALEEATTQRIAGKKLTPFLLSSMAQSTGGASLKANMALLENNARVAARIAGCVARRDSGGS